MNVYVVLISVIDLVITKWVTRFEYYWIILLPWMIMDKVLILLFKYMPMVQLLFNELCILQKELIFVVSNLFIGKRFSLKCAGRVSNPAHQYRCI